MKVLLATMRPPFLVITPVSILLGVAASSVRLTSDVLIDILLIMIGGLLAHISVNMLNEYHDYRSGLDKVTQRTPFSGGSGGLIENPAVLNQVYRVAMGCLVLTILVGVYFVWTRGWMILPLGLLGIMIVLAYTPWLNRYPWLCLVAPGLGVGPVMVLGTCIALGADYTVEAFLISLVPFFLGNNLLLVNQFPDVEADRTVGRRHFPITFGLRYSMRIYMLFVLATVLTILSGTMLGFLPQVTLFSLIPMGLLVPVMLTLGKQETFSTDEIRLLGLNVAATIMTPLVLSGALLFA